MVENEELNEVQERSAEQRWASWQSLRVSHQSSLGGFALSHEF